MKITIFSLSKCLGLLNNFKKETSIEKKRQKLQGNFIKLIYKDSKNELNLEKVQSGSLIVNHQGTKKHVHTRDTSY